MFTPRRLLFAGLILSCLASFFFASPKLFAFDFARFSPSAKPTPETITAAIAALGKDNVKWNFAFAFDYLMKNRKAALPFLVAALPNKDGQREHGILRILVAEPSFRPTSEQLDLCFTHIVSHAWRDDDRIIRQPNLSLRYDLILYLVEQANTCKASLSSHLNSEDSFTMWVTTFILSQANLLDEFRPKIATKTLEHLAANLRNDNIDYNAAFAVRTFLLLANQGVPILRKSSTSQDSQQRELSKLILEYLKTHDFAPLDQIGTGYAPTESGYLPVNEKGQLLPASVWKERYIDTPPWDSQWNDFIEKWFQKKERASSKRF